MALSLDLVVVVFQPHDESFKSPLLKIVAIRLLCNLTSVLPYESTVTEVFAFDQSRRSTIAACISDSILRMGVFPLTTLIV